MLSWDLYFTLDKTALIDKDFDREHDQIILKAPFLDSMFNIDIQFDVCLEHLSLASVEAEQRVEGPSRSVVDEGCFPSEKPQECLESEELPYDESTSTELLIFKWGTCPEPGRVYFYHRWDDQAADDVFEAGDDHQAPLVRVHLHRARCKARTLVKAMQETRRMALPRNFRRIYFGGNYLRGKRTKRSLPRVSVLGNKL